MISLTGTAMLVICAVLALGLPVLTIVYLPRVRGRRRVRVVQRGALLVGCQLTVVLLAAVAVNDAEGFFGSWTSLLQQPQPRSVRIVAGGGTPSTSPRPHGSSDPSGGIIQGGDPTPSASTQWPRTGRLESITITGAASTLTEHAFVYLPPQYFQPDYAHVRFPAVEALSDYPGTESSLLPYSQAMLSLINARRVAPTVLVMLRPATTYPRDTECTDVPAGPQAETFHARDIPSQLAGTYRIRSTGWGAIGVGTGGYCAAKLSMIHPRVFTAAVLDHGYFTAVRTAATGDLWAGSGVLRAENDLQWRLQHLPAPPVSIMAVSSTDRQGPTGYRNTERFSSLVAAPMMVDLVIHSHPSPSVTAQSEEELTWLCARLPNPGSSP